MTCQKTKSKLGNRRVRLDPAISLQKCWFRFRLRESRSFSNRSREKDQTSSLLCLLSTERDGLTCIVVTYVMILVASAIDRKYLGI